MSKEAMKLALEALEGLLNKTSGQAIYSFMETERRIAMSACVGLRQAIAEAEKQEQGEPVAFLANGTRFKISYDSRQSGGQIHGIPPELGGCWVAFVAADDDCHLKLTTPQQRKPLTYEQIFLCVPQDGDLRSFARSIETAHGIKGDA